MSPIWNCDIACLVIESYSHTPKQVHIYCVLRIWGIHWDLPAAAVFGQDKRLEMSLQYTHAEVNVQLQSRVDALEAVEDACTLAEAWLPLRCLKLCWFFWSQVDGTSDTKVEAVWSFGIASLFATCDWLKNWVSVNGKELQDKKEEGDAECGCLKWLCCFDSTKNAYGFLFACLLVGNFYRKIPQWIEFCVSPCEVFDVLLAGTWYLRPSILVEGKALTSGKFVKSRIFDLSGTFGSRLLG